MFPHREEDLYASRKISNKYSSVGGDVPLCTVPTFPNRKCSLPFEKRYGLMGGFLYSEHHLHNLTITGFMANSTCPGTYSAAFALNPTQIDTNPVVVSSDISWVGQSDGLMDIGARLGLQISDSDKCTAGDCMGLNRLIIHDHRGFLKGTADSILGTVALRAQIGGKILFDNPEYVDEGACQVVPALGLSIYSCLDVTINNVEVRSIS